VSQVVIGSCADLLASLASEPPVVLGTLLLIARQPERARAMAAPELGEALHRLAGNAAIPELREAAEQARNAYEARPPESEPERQARQLTRLAQHEGLAALPRLEAALEAHWLVRAAAARALLTLGDEGRAVLAAHPRPELRALT
jgi:hypothetical protein